MYSLSYSHLNGVWMLETVLEIHSKLYGFMGANIATSVQCRNNIGFLNSQYVRETAETC